jgi:uncharacterized protein (DUF885 family)
LVDDYIGGYLAFRPGTATGLGLHQFDGKTVDYSRDSVDAELARLKSFDGQLADLGASGLSAQNAFDFRLLRDSVRREIFGIEAMGRFTNNPSTYVEPLDVTLYVKRDFAPLPERMRALDAILNAAPGLLAAARTNLQDSLPRPLIETAVARASATADFLENNLPDAVKAVTDRTLQTQFNEADHVAIRELRAYADWLTNVKLPKANDQYALGRENFVHLLECEEVATPPEELLTIAQRELTTKQKVFAQAAQLIDPAAGNPVDVWRSLNRESPAADELVSAVARNFETLRDFTIGRHLVTIPPDARVIVMATPPYLRPTTFAALDLPGPFETRDTVAWYYVTPVDSNWPPEQQSNWLSAFNFYSSAVGAIHEAYPGHYEQALQLAASPVSFPEKIFSSYAFNEGWAHYCEQMVIDEGFAGDVAPGQGVRAAKFRLAQTDEALLRICRMIVSIRLHCDGMTVAEAARFFQDNCYCDARTALDEGARATYDPEYMDYTLGKLEIIKLREDYHRQEGAGFSLQKFHDELLRHGMPPIRLLREVMLNDRASWDQAL